MAVDFQSRGRFVELADGLSDLLGVPPGVIEHDLDSALTVAFEFDEISFSLQHEPELNSSQAMLECTFGAPPEDANVALALLETSLDLMRSGDGWLAVRGDPAQLVFGIRVELETATVEQLMSLVRLRAESARAWQSRHWIVEAAQLEDEDDDASSIAALGRDVDAQDEGGPGSTEACAPRLGALLRDSDARSASPARRQFSKLIERVNCQVEVSPCNPLVDGEFACSMDVGETRVILAHETPAATRFSMEVDFGDVPRSLRVLLRLLRLNAELLPLDAGFGFEMTSGRLVYYHASPVDLADDLMPHLQLMDREAAAWRNRVHDGSESEWFVETSIGGNTFELPRFA